MNYVTTWLYIRLIQKWALSALVENPERAPRRRKCDSGMIDLNKIARGVSALSLSVSRILGLEMGRMAKPLENIPMNVGKGSGGGKHLQLDRVSPSLSSVRPPVEFLQVCRRRRRRGEGTNFRDSRFRNTQRTTRGLFFFWKMKWARFSVSFQFMQGVCSKAAVRFCVPRLGTVRM